LPRVQHEWENLMQQQINDSSWHIVLSTQVLILTAEKDVVILNNFHNIHLNQIR